MTETGFFLPGDAPSRAYRNIRDKMDGPAPQARAFIEDLWTRYGGLEDPHFLQDARAHFLERFWEMYLAVSFMERGLKPARGGNAGPEFWCEREGQKIWVEAVAPGPGTGEDRVEEPEIGVATYVPTEKILLRFTSAVAEKRRRYLAATKKGLVDESAAYVLAINSRGIPHAPFGNTLPFFVQALLPIGAPTLVVDRATGKPVDSYYALRDTIQKSAGTAISTSTFLDPESAFISAVIHSGVDCVNRPAVLSDDFCVLHNPSASRPLGMTTFAWCKQYVFADGELKVHTG